MIYDIILKILDSFPRNTNFAGVYVQEYMSKLASEAIKKELIMKLSDQALGAIMMALQKSILTQSDITNHLKCIDFTLDENEQLIAVNPPNFEVPSDFLGDSGNATSGSD